MVLIKTSLIRVYGSHQNQLNKKNWISIQFFLFAKLEFFREVIIISNSPDLDFFDIPEDYVKHLKNFDSSVPSISKTDNKKFFCGIVLKINNFNYYVPISSFKDKQATNKIIYDKQGNPIASLRFCFMIPLPQENNIAVYKDFNQVPDKKYVALMNKELIFCRQHQESIIKDAERVYNYGINPEHPQYRNCCKFMELEKAATMYPEN